MSLVIHRCRRCGDEFKMMYKRFSGPPQDICDSCFVAENQAHKQANTIAKTEPAWTSEPPKEPGWYWARSQWPNGDYQVEVVQVQRGRDGLLYGWPGCPEREMRVDWLDKNTEWYSQPIPEPPR